MESGKEAFDSTSSDEDEGLAGGRPAVHFTDVFWELLTSTTGYPVPHVEHFVDAYEAETHRAHAARLEAEDPVAREEKESATTAAATQIEIERFERKLRKGGGAASNAGGSSAPASAPASQSQSDAGNAAAPAAAPAAPASVVGTLDWSNEARLVGDLPPGLCRAELMGSFRSLRLPNLGLNVLDLDAFVSLTELDVSSNQALGEGAGGVGGVRLPERLQVLDAVDCALTEPFVLPPGTLHAGYGYNALGDTVPAMCRDACPHLVSLDMAFNSLCDLGTVLDALGGMPALRQLFLAGNPVALLPRYRRRVLQACIEASKAGSAGAGGSGGGMLQLLDNVPVDPNAPLATAGEEAPPLTANANADADKDTRDGSATSNDDGSAMTDTTSGETVQSRVEVEAQARAEALKADAEVGFHVQFKRLEGMLQPPAVEGEAVEEQSSGKGGKGGKGSKGSKGGKGGKGNKGEPEDEGGDENSPYRFVVKVLLPGASGQQDPGCPEDGHGVAASEAKPWQVAIPLKGSATARLPPTVEMRDAVLFGGARVLVFEQTLEPPREADECEDQAPPPRAVASTALVATGSCSLAHILDASETLGNNVMTFEGDCALKLEPWVLQRQEQARAAAAEAAAAAAAAAEEAGKGKGKGKTAAKLLDATTEDSDAIELPPRASLVVKLNWVPPPTPIEPDEPDAKASKGKKGKKGKGKKK